MECNLLHSNLNINLNLILNLIQKDAITVAPRIVLDETSDPAKLTHTINHQIQEAGRGWPGMGVLSVHRGHWSLRAGPARCLSSRCTFPISWTLAFLICPPRRPRAPAGHLLGRAPPPEDCPGAWGRSEFVHFLCVQLFLESAI